MKKIIIYNIIFLVLFIFVAEYIARCIYFKKINFSNIRKEIAWDNTNLSDGDAFILETGQEILTFRNIEKKKNTLNESIILGGCSFTFGNMLKYNDTFSSILSRNTDRNIYNLGMNGASPRDFLYILRNKNVLNKLLNLSPNEKVKYVIYTYIDDQEPRLFANIYRKSPSFKLKKGKLKYYKQNQILLKSFIFFYITKYIAYNIIPKKFQDKVLTYYFKEIYEEIKNNFGAETIFVILVYINNNDIWNELTQIGIKVIYANDINSDILSNKYKAEDHCHPNKRAWEQIVPYLINELHL